MCCAIAASWKCWLLLGLTHSQYWCTSSGLRSIGCFGAAVDGVGYDVKTWHFGVGIHSFGGGSGGSGACRDFGLIFKIGRGILSFSLFLVLQTAEFISAIFSLIGAILAELQSFSCFWASILVLECGILGSIREICGISDSIREILGSCGISDSIREILGSTRDVSGLGLA